MPEKDFQIEEKQDKEGYSFSLTYSRKYVLLFQHRRDHSTPNDYILNYNIHVPSDKSICDNVESAMLFLKKLEQKEVRGFEQALKDADMYYNTIFEKRKFAPEVIGYGRSNFPEDIAYNAEEIKKAVNNNYLDDLVIRTPLALMVMIKMYKREDFDHLHLDKKPETQISIDGFDWNIADEISDFILKTDCTQIPEQDVPYLKDSLTKLLNQFKVNVKKKARKH